MSELRPGEVIADDECNDAADGFVRLHGLAAWKDFCRMRRSKNIILTEKEVLMAGMAMGFSSALKIIRDAGNKRSCWPELVAGLREWPVLDEEATAAADMIEHFVDQIRTVLEQMDWRDGQGATDHVMRSWRERLRALVETKHASSKHSGHPREDDSSGEDDPAAAGPQP